MSDPIAFAFGMLFYVLSGAVIGGVSAFYVNLEWLIFGRRCPTYGEFMSRIMLGALAGLPVFIIALIAAGCIWISDRPSVKAFLRKPMCRRNP